MKNKIVNVPSIREPITASPGFAKKLLSDFKLDLAGLCGFGCVYCSSNWGNYLRINRKKFAALAREQIGKPLTPFDDAALVYAWPDVLEKLNHQLDKHDQSWGQGETLVFSMLTDGFSPQLVKDGVTEKALRAVLDRTSFRIRILTKNACVGSAKWIRFIEQHRQRFVVGLSIGTLDDKWAKRVEIGTPAPTARIRALQRLQDAGIPTYGMLCPVFPEALEGDHLERLVDAIRPDLVEHVWAEPFNDRVNWKHVRKALDAGSAGYKWLTDVYENRNTAIWSSYATEQYCRLRDKARVEGWLSKLRFLLYEGDINEDDARRFSGLEGVLLQSKPGEHGMSPNPSFVRLQQEEQAA